jgi:hypothetical protein
LFRERNVQAATRRQRAVARADTLAFRLAMRTSGRLPSAVLPLLLELLLENLQADRVPGGQGQVLDRGEHGLARHRRWQLLLRQKLSRCITHRGSKTRSKRFVVCHPWLPP